LTLEPTARDARLGGCEAGEGIDATRAPGMPASPRLMFRHGVDDA
jgi:hypothetical protein